MIPHVAVNKLRIINAWMIRPEVTRGHQVQGSAQHGTLSIAVQLYLISLQKGIRL